MTPIKANATGAGGEGGTTQNTQYNHTVNPEISQDFLGAILASGLTPPQEIIADGRLHRFPSNGKKASKAGWYVLHSDGVPAGVFGDWRTGFAQTWRARTTRQLTVDETAANRERLEAMRQQREQNQTVLHLEAQAKAQWIWNSATPAPVDHPYLVRKGIAAYGTRLFKKLIVIPVADALHGTLRSLQFITADGAKRFLTGGSVKGCCHGIGAPGALLFVCEGFATGATIHDATGHAVAVAFNAGNLLEVAKAMRAKFPNSRLCICADDDHQTEGNPGITKAKEASLEVGAWLFIPQFGAGRPACATDFNDLATWRGIDTVREQISWN